MTFTRTILLGVGLWVAGITLLYFFLNWEPDSGKFKVGFLPVT
jgi:hypothetical protein